MHPPLSSTGLLWEDELENSDVFMPQIPLFPNNILGIACVLPSTLISQHGLLGVQRTPKDGVTPGLRGLQNAVVQLSQETDAGSMNILPSESIAPRAKADGHPGFFCHISMVSPNSPLLAKNIKPGLGRTAMHVHTHARVCVHVHMCMCVCMHARVHVESM